MANVFNDTIWKKYGNVNEETKILKLNNIPFHSVLYSGEIIKFYLKDVLKQYKSCSKIARQQFEKENFEGNSYLI